MRALRVCSAPGCATLTREGRCRSCLPKRTRRYRPKRKKTAERGYDARHKRWRKLILAKDPVCRGCRRAPSTIADHVIPLSQDGGWSEDNGQGLCVSCHAYKTHAERKDPDFGKRLRAEGVPKGWRYAA